MQELAVQFKHISMEFPGVLANDDVSLDIRRGEGENDRIITICEGDGT